MKLQTDVVHILLVQNIKWCLQGVLFNKPRFLNLSKSQIEINPWQGSKLQYKWWPIHLWHEMNTKSWILELCQLYIWRNHFIQYFYQSDILILFAHSWMSVSSRYNSTSRSLLWFIYTQCQKKKRPHVFCCPL